MARNDIFQQLSTKQLGDVPSTEIATVTRNVHIEKSNEELLRTAVLVNEASLRRGHPIPGTGVCAAFDITENKYTPIVETNEGDCFQIAGVATGTMAGGTMVLTIHDPTSGVYVEIDQTSTATTAAGFPNYLMHIPYPLQLVVLSSSVSGTMQVYVAYSSIY